MLSGQRVTRREGAGEEEAFEHRRGLRDRAQISELNVEPGSNRTWQLGKRIKGLSFGGGWTWTLDEAEIRSAKGTRELKLS